MKNIPLRSGRQWAVEIITALLLVFFVHSAIDNYTSIISLQHLLVFYTKNVVLVSWVIVIVEAGIAILLFFPKTRTAGYIVSLAFFLTLITVVEIKPHAPHFFGGILSYLSRKQYFPFEIGITALTITGLSLKLIRKRQSSLSIAIS